MSKDVVNAFFIQLCLYGVPILWVLAIVVNFYLAFKKDDFDSAANHFATAAIMTFIAVLTVAMFWYFNLPDRLSQ